jgi:protein TonB
MTRTVTLFQFMPYGAPELQSVARPYMVRALLASAALGTMLFAAAGLLQPLLGGASAPPRNPLVIQLDNIRPPAPLDVVLPAPVAPAAAKSAMGSIPVPRPDVLVPPDRTIPSQDDLNRAQPGMDTGTGDRPIVVEPSQPAEKLPEPGTYVYREEEPVPVTIVKPDYPGLAKDANVSGLVVVTVLVGKDGHVLDARVEPSHSIPLLNDAALAAVRRWVFTPAFADKRPVAVWVAVPFHFSLHQGE